MRIKYFRKEPVCIRYTRMIIDLFLLAINKAFCSQASWLSLEMKQTRAISEAVSPFLTSYTFKFLTVLVPCSRTKKAFFFCVEEFGYISHEFYLQSSTFVVVSCACPFVCITWNSSKAFVKSSLNSCAKSLQTFFFLLLFWSTVKKI